MATYNDLKLIQTNDDVYLFIDSGTATTYKEASLIFQHGSVTRWAIEKDNVANADLYIRRYNSSGVLQDSPVLIAGSNGDITFTASSTWTLAADDVITIDAGTTDHTASTVITADVDVNSASCKFINLDMDVGTALSSGENIYGAYLDVDGNAGDNAAATVTGLYLTSANTSTGITAGLAIAGTWDESLTIASTSGKADIDCEIDSRDYFCIFDDFLYQTITEADTPWILNSGADAQAIDPAINAQEGGVIRVTTGDADGTVANDASQLVCHIPVQADSGGLVFETRLHINTAVTTVSVNAGLTDSTSLEEPFSIGGSDAITSTASDAVCFVYDTGADTDEWFMCAVDSDTDDTGIAATGTAPVADTYQILRIEVSSDGATCRFYINGTLEGTLTGGGVSPDVNLYATVIANATTTTQRTVDVDYIYVGHNR